MRYSALIIIILHFLGKSWRMFTIYVYLRKEIVQNNF